MGFAGVHEGRRCYYFCQLLMKEGNGSTVYNRYVQHDEVSTPQAVR